MHTDLAQARVLLVDDNRDDELLFRHHCSKIPGCNWQIDHAASYADACALIAKGPHDLYFFDYRLGGHNGIELLHELHKLCYIAPVILITGLDDDQIGEDALIAGATDFLPKQELSPSVILRAARYAGIRRRAENQLQISAREDPLTRIFNRSYFMQLADIELIRAHRFGHPISLLLLDIDNFKITNDTHGHAAGDSLLLAVIECCRQTMRESDLIGRWGGDEFVVLLPQTNLNGADVIAQRICSSISRARVSVGNHILIGTVSIGVACQPPPQKLDMSRFVEDADRALYRAKQAGRNRLVLADTA